MKLGMLAAIVGTVEAPRRLREPLDWTRGPRRSQEDAEAHRQLQAERKKERQRKKKARKARR